MNGNEIIIDFERDRKKKKICIITTRALLQQQQHSFDYQLSSLYAAS
jgi:hypothetical protein